MLRSLLITAGVAATALAGPVAAIPGLEGAAAATAPTDVTPEPSPDQEQEQDEEEPSPQPSPEEPDPPEDENTEPEQAPDTEGPVTEPAECGAMDYSCLLTVGVYLWFVEVIADGLNATLQLLATPALMNPAPTAGVETTWESARAVVNSVYVLVVAAAGLVLMSYQTVQTSAGIKDVLPRLVLGFIAANASFWLTEMMREVTNAVAVSLLDGAVTMENLTQTLTRLLSDPVGELLTVILLMLLAIALFFFFALGLLIRIVLWLLLTAAAPLALACHALPQTEGVARLWWRSMGALMLIQIGQALVLRAMVAVFLGRDPGLDVFEATGAIVDVLLVIACLYVLVRIPFWAFKNVFNYQASPLVKGAKLAASVLVFRHLGKAVAGQKAGKAAKTARTAPVGRHGQQATPARSPSKPAQHAPRRPRWHQPALPGMRPRPSAASEPTSHGKQQPPPGTDARPEPPEQQRPGQHRPGAQPPLHSDGPDRPADHRQPDPQQQSERRRRAVRESAAQQHIPPGRRPIPPRHRGRNPRGRS